MTSDLGLLLVVQCINKSDPEVRGVAQKLEKTALRRGLVQLVAQEGYIVLRVATDQCSGAETDILKAVEELRHGAGARHAARQPALRPPAR